jgi:uncharacterized membrane protein YfcA
VELVAGFTWPEIAIALAITFAGAFVRGVAGFGMAIILVPVLALALTPVEAVLVTNVVALLVGLAELRRLLREADRSALAISALVAVATAPGLALLAVTPAPLARMLIALVAISAFVAVLRPVRAANRPGLVATVATGLSSGLLTGFAGMPGPPVVPYYVRRAIARRTAKASMLLIFTVAALAGLLSGAALGVMHWRLALLGVLLFPMVVLGNWLGNLASDRIDDRAWRGFVALVLAASAVAALVKLL